MTFYTLNHYIKTNFVKGIYHMRICVYGTFVRNVRSGRYATYCVGTMRTPQHIQTLGNAYKLAKPSVTDQWCIRK